MTDMPDETERGDIEPTDEGADGARLGERQCLPVVNLSALRIEVVSMRRDVAKQVPDISGDAARRFQRKVTELACLRESAQQEAGAPSSSVRVRS
jgi:hypothetical protein